jgi:hypothetical protein
VVGSVMTDLVEVVHRNFVGNFRMTRMWITIEMFLAIGDEIDEGFCKHKE